MPKKRGNRRQWDSGEIGQKSQNTTANGAATQQSTTTNTTIKQHWCTGVCSSCGGFRSSQQQGNDNGNGDTTGKAKQGKTPVKSGVREQNSHGSNNQPSNRMPKCNCGKEEYRVKQTNNNQRNKNWVPTCVGGSHVTLTEIGCNKVANIEQRNY